MENKVHSVFNFELKACSDNGEFLLHYVRSRFHVQKYFLLQREKFLSGGRPSPLLKTCNVSLKVSQFLACNQSKQLHREFFSVLETFVCAFISNKEWGACALCTISHFD
jgi:hypothetical protein